MNTATSQIKETVVPELMPRYVQRIDENGHYVILKEKRANTGFNRSYPHEYVFHDGDILTSDEYDERIHIEFVIKNLENATSHEKIITFLEAETKERLLEAYRWGLNTLHTILLNKKQSKKFIVQQLAKGIVEWQKELDNARNHQNNIIINADVADIPERSALPEVVNHTPASLPAQQLEALPATSQCEPADDTVTQETHAESQSLTALPDKKRDCHKFCVGDFFTFCDDELYTVIKRTPCYVFLHLSLQNKLQQTIHQETIRARLGVYDRDYSYDGTIKGDEFITFEVSKHGRKIDAKDKEEKPAELEATRALPVSIQHNEQPTTSQHVDFPEEKTETVQDCHALSLIANSELNISDDWDKLDYMTNIDCELWCIQHDKIAERNNTLRIQNCKTPEQAKALLDSGS
ncbi:MAG: hypothetical protein IJS42_03555, partial [Synergistaceae bacterium]|nr:hypothetical protein [Synergistaceae bacterium]